VADDGDGVVLAGGRAGVSLRLRVKPGARRTRLVGAHGGALKLEVAAPPERGKANAAVTRLLAGVLGVRRSDVVITGGETSQDKRVEVAGTTAVAVAAALRREGVEVA
jgi:uncharacterized protein (TIGR00251 family)